ncbi:hypothetical protein IWW49_003887 [Coemansia sp. RSA 1797]|nr:hypothetical protein IWW49_003887 [Coemansia sp. RSA 1797]
MSYLPTQPVGERVRFQSQMPGSMHSNDLQTPTRQGNTMSPFCTTLRRSTYFEPESKANPFTPRVDRGLSPAGSRMLARRTTTLGTARTARSRLNITDTASNGAEGSKQVPFAATGEYPALGGVGGWPVGSSVTTSAPLNSTLPAGESEQGSKTPFSRPKSPATRSASPHRNAKKLPSFLLGSMQSVKSSGANTPYPPDTALTANSTAAVTIFSIPSANPSTQAPLSRPVSPRVSRRISGFGSNDMLSSAYRSSGAGSSRGVGPASSLDDAPPIMTLDDMDMEHPGEHMRENDGLADTDVFAMQTDGSATNVGHQQTAIDSNAAGNEQDYNDVKARAVVVSGLPANTESSTLNYFRSFGEILAFSGVPGASDTLALLFSEPWQAQRAVAQGDSSGRILLDDRIVARVDRADAPSVSLLFKQVFPGRPLPSSAAPPVTESFTFSQAIYAQSPRRRPAASAPTHGRSRIEAVREVEARSSGSAGSPFRHKQVLTHSAPASTSTVMASENGQASVLSSSAPKPRNGLLQSVLDILFGW